MQIFSKLKDKLKGKPVDTSLRVIRLDEVDSTNNYLRQYHPSDEEQMVVAVAEHQTAGRGQGTNSWESEAGQNLTFSVLTRPTWVPVARQFLLSEAGALALKDVLDTYTDGIRLKWPNDIYWHDRKLSGTLIELNVSQRGISRCVFGVGLNVNQRTFVSDAPNPVSLAQILGKDVDKDQLLEQLIASFRRYSDLTLNGAYMDIAAMYHEALYRSGDYYPFRDKDGEFMGRIFEVEDDGHVLLHDKQGVIRRYAFKEVEFVINQ